MAFEFTDKNFKEEALVKDSITVVDFWAEWCGPCKMIGPIVEDLAKEYAGKVKIGKMDVDNNPVTPGEYGVRAIPTIIFLKNGELVDKQVGAATRQVLKNKIDTLLGVTA